MASPAKDYLLTERQALKELRRTMRDLQKNVNEALRNPSLTGISSQVDYVRAQALKQQLDILLTTTYVSIDDMLQRGFWEVQRKAAEIAAKNERVFWQIAQDAKVPLSHVITQESLTTAATVETLAARLTKSRIELSSRVWKSEALVSGRVESIINQALLRGDSWQKLSKSLRDFVNPNTPGGVTYAANRLARTEINNAFQASTIERYKEGFTKEVDWRLSRSHKKKDECDDLAANGPYLIDEVPDKPHPQCLCTITPVVPKIGKEMDDFVSDLVKEFLAEQKGL